MMIGTCLQLYPGANSALNITIHCPEIKVASKQFLDALCSIQSHVHDRYFDHQPDQSGKLSLLLSTVFLNNSSSRWEQMVESWPVEVHLSDPINPSFKTNRTK